MAARLARSEKRVFSDSEIYSPVFPRGRPPGEPEGRKGAAAPADVSARVRAMKKGGAHSIGSKFTLGQIMLLCVGQHWASYNIISFCFK